MAQLGRSGRTAWEEPGEGLEGLVKELGLNEEPSEASELRSDTHSSVSKTSSAEL